MIKKWHWLIKRGVCANFVGYEFVYCIFSWGGVGEKEWDQTMTITTEGSYKIILSILQHIQSLIIRASRKNIEITLSVVQLNTVICTISVLTKATIMVYKIFPSHIDSNLSFLNHCYSPLGQAFIICSRGYSVCFFITLWPHLSLLALFAFSFIAVRFLTFNKFPPHQLYNPKRYLGPVKSCKPGFNGPVLIYSLLLAAGCLLRQMGFFHV